MKGYINWRNNKAKELAEIQGVNYELWLNRRPIEYTDNERRLVSILNKLEKTERPPYCDFWHWFADAYNISNGCHTYLCLSEDEIEEYEDYIKEVLRLIKKEFAPDCDAIDFYVWW